MFDRIALRYDRMNRLMTLGLDRSWRRRAVAALGLRPGERVLDLACGTGDLADEVRRAGALAIGIDVSAGMLRVASRRSVAPGALVRGDALGLPFGGGSFDAVVSGFALRNFADAATALGECGRVLRPGGRLALLEVDTPSHLLLRAGHRLWFRGLIPALGRFLAEGDAYSYLPASVVYLPDERGLRTLLEAAGFEAARKTTFLGGAAQLVVARRSGGDGRD